MTRFAHLIAGLWLCLLHSQGLAAADTFPRLMGMNIGEKHYHMPYYQQDLAKLDILILGFYKGWEPRKGYTHAAAVRDIQARNPRLLIGQYTVLNEARDVPNDNAMAEVVAKLGWNGWWLRDANGERVQWSRQYSAWETNFTQWAKPDANGERYPQWSMRRNYEAFFRDVPEMRIWYTDNVMHRPRVRADWDGDGMDDDPDDPRILAAWRQGYQAWWASIRVHHPDIWIVGNADSDLSEPEFAGQLDGAFLEGLMGKTWSLERRRGWAGMMQRYRDVGKHLRGPRIVGFNVWGNPNDYRFFRYAFASCLMGDGYFSFTDEKRGYSSVPWFDEYDVKLGKATSPTPSRPLRNGVWRRDFEHGVVLVNPGLLPQTVVLEPGLRHFAGKQAPERNNGLSVSPLSLPGKDGVVLIKSGTAP
jgi:hypothetical protein